MAKVLIVFFMIFPLWQYSFADGIRDKIDNREYRLTGESGIPIIFSGDLLAGETVVNYYTSTYEIKGDEIRFGNIGVTKRMGSKDDMKKE